MCTIPLSVHISGIASTGGRNFEYISSWITVAGFGLMRRDLGFLAEQFKMAD